ncbi:MAG: DUF87 domain-containing protein [Bdellovibrionales bacterium]|nr:DUF87 domain-containing protein [Bdellovibrionales bacterium]
MTIEKENNLENIMEEIISGIWNIIQFSLLPIKAHSQTVAIFENFIRSFVCCSLIAGGFWIYSFSYTKDHIFNGENFLWLFVIGTLIFSIRHLYFLYFNHSSIQKKITVEDLKNKKLTFHKLFSLIKNPKYTPLGISLISKKPVLLDIKSRVQHTIVSGATGQGKTTLLKTMLIHSLKHNHPIIIIDPKGEREDILEMKQKAHFYGREKDFYLFSLSFPEESISYNPLLNGTAQQIKARLMGGLSFKHDYYKAQADLFLGGILSALQFLNKPVSFALLDCYLNNTNEIKFLIEDISSIETNSNLHSHVHELLSILEQIQMISKKDLAGLQAQISSINCLEFREILSGCNNKSNNTFSFEECLKNNKIAYFQMNVNGYGEISRQIGRMIIQDLKVLSSRVQSGQKNFSYDFCACFIDEFGSFVTWDSADFLKMARSARIGIHLFCQGLSDLSQVNNDFKNQIIGNTTIKILFRQDIGKDVEEWAGVAGTFSSQKKTYQIIRAEKDEEMTGIGSIRDVKEMKIEFDVFKRLSPGQAVLIDKACHKEDLFQVWRPAL